MENGTNELLNLVSTNALEEHFIPSCQTKEYLNEALGCAIAGHFGWNGIAILETFMGALEDANFHAEVAMVQDMLDKYK